MHTFGYTNVSSGDSTQLTYLRSRYYSSGTGRFLTRDTWGGDYNRPLSLNRWMYVEGNPINRVDPSGQCYNPDGSWNWFEWPWFGWGPCSSVTNGATPTLTPTLIAILIATATCTPTPSSTGTPTPSYTLTSTPYVEPWKRYRDYDSGSNSIPRDKWGALDSNAWDVKRAELVWGWIGEAQGKWWNGKYPDAKELTTWLLFEEGGPMFSQLDNDNVYDEGGGIEGAKLMIRWMKGLFSNGIDKYDLAKFTSFFNPDGLKPFDQNDWNELMTPPPYYPFGNTVERFWNIAPLEKELIFWSPGEPGFDGYAPKHTVRHPNGGSVIMYFGYK